MKKTKHDLTFIKFILITLVILMMFSFASCSNSEGDTKLVFTTGFNKDEVFKVGKISCTREEIMVLLTNTQNQYEEVYGEQIWNSSVNGVNLEENVKDTVLAKIAQIKSMYLLAMDKEIELSEEEMQAVENAAHEYYSSLNEREIELMGISYDTIKNLYEEFAVADKLYENIIQDVNPEISDDEARIITVQHILIRTRTVDDHGNITEYSAEKKAESYEEIKRIYEMALSGEYEFTDLASEYSQDENITYSFGKGELDPAFEAAAFELDTEEISNIVESDIGYHIIKCISTFDREETDLNKIEIVDKRRKEAFGEEYDEYVNSLVRQLNESLWSEITLIHDESVNTSTFFDVFEKYIDLTL